MGNKTAIVPYSAKDAPHHACAYVYTGGSLTCALYLPTLLLCMYTSCIAEEENESNKKLHTSVVLTGEPLAEKRVRSARVQTIKGVHVRFRVK